jgi:hypothetical protein
MMRREEKRISTQSAYLVEIRRQRAEITISVFITGIDDEDIEETRVHWRTTFEGKLTIAKVPIL